MMAPSTILITGATGVVGRALVEQLGDREIVCVVHRNRELPRDVEVCRGDLREPGLGLTPRDLAALASRVTHVVHCAAVTDFRRPPAEIHAVNLHATRHVLDFAADAQARVLHLSTAFVGRSEAAAAGLESAGEGNEWSQGIFAYVRSKQACERLVVESGLPATIARPSLVIGDSCTGAITRFQGIHLLMSFVLRGEMPLLPVPAETLVDFLPQDVVARALVGILDLEAPEREYWLTAGAQAAKLEDLVDQIVEFAAALRAPVDRPKLVDPDLIDRLIRPVFIDLLPPPMKRRFELMLALLRLYQRQDAFPSSLAELLDGAADLRLERAFANGMGYWARQQGLGGVPALAS